MTIIIDAGHGGKDPGTHGFGAKEKDWTLDVSLYQYHRFKELGVSVSLTRDHDITLDSSERSNIVKNSGADFCISNHFNAGGGSGCETIHSIFTNAKLAEKLGHGIADVGGMSYRRTYSRRDQNGLDYYYMHRLTGRVRTIIVEYGFIDNEHDYNLLNTSKERQIFAEAVVRAMCNWIGADYRKPEHVKQSVDMSGTFYRVQVGAFKKRQNADELKDELQHKGYQAIVKG
ncbi:N-acetylmuramoyl-L-alanine amidase [Tuberibacillus sp. Marseille-P3662]|uniref:N-acetylmuramoyl-L-alanine amidase n=1 Tax=Tuberibacillus sp. Marseille-P3662 TaxID=1965358 RepID=UPI0015941A63|nr:N-acetylmuramoyl-L-alanine amidase [Tuberibacillus sp. Marseille-P3662]